MMLKNFKLEFFSNFFFTKCRRNVISGIGYGVGISFLLVTLVFGYHTPPSSLLNYDSSFRYTICFSKSSRNVLYISWFRCHPSSTSVNTSPTSSLKVSYQESRNMARTGVHNETIYINNGGDRSHDQDGKNISSLLVDEFGDKANVKQEDSLDGNPKNITSSTTTDPQLGNYTSTSGEEQECDIFDGKWVLKEEAKEPYYPPGSCPFVDSRHDCGLNKRPDSGYLKWQWQPNGCNIPRLNASDFLLRMGGKRLVFVGDSLNRNMWESLVCILWNISTKVTRKAGSYSVRYEDYNCSIEWESAPFLVSTSTYFNATSNQKSETLRLDEIDKQATLSRGADIIVFNSWHWWNHHKIAQGQNYFQEGNKVYPELNVLKAYEKALTTWRKWVDSNIDSSKTQVVFRGYSDTHFRGGKWNTGGKCSRETEPISSEAEYKKQYPLKVEILEQVLKRMKAPVLYLNVTKLTYYRADGHVSIYGKQYKTAEEMKNAAENAGQDCNHWCVPGIPDVWNELLYNSLLKIRKL